MGKEIRRLPCWWQHPRDGDGNYLPVIDRAYDEAIADYRYAERLWEQGRHPSQLEWPGPTEGKSYREWDGCPPDPRFYRSESWTEDDATCVALYETISEGTPLSPTFSSMGELSVWMLQNGYTQAEVAEIVRVGSLPTMVAYKLGADDELF